MASYFDENGDLKDGAVHGQLEDGFFYAFGYGHLEVVRYLLDRGAAAGMTNARGETGLHWAMYGPHLDVIEALLQHRPPIDARDALGGTALDWAVNGWARCSNGVEREQMFEAIVALLRAGARLTRTWFDQNERRCHALARVRSDSQMLALLTDQFRDGRH